MMTIALLLGVVFSPLGLNVYAQSTYTESIVENVDLGDAYEDVRILVRENLPQTRNANKLPDLELDYRIKSTNQSVHFERIDTTGYYYVDGQLITTVDYNSEQISRRIVTIPNGIKTLPGEIPVSGFSSYYYSGHQYFTIRNLQPYFLNKLKEEAISLMVSGLIGALPGYFLIVALRDVYVLASDFWDYIDLIWMTVDVFEGLDFSGVDVFYGSYHGQCNALAYYGYSAYPVIDGEADENFSSVFERNSRHTWNANPNDYTQPAACRVLVTDYPLNPTN